MEGGARDTTQDWLIDDAGAPPLLGELVERIDDALRIARASEKAARSSEEAARSVGETAAEAAVAAAGRARDAVEQAMRAAEHARRSAELAERASNTMLKARPGRPTLPRTPPEDPSLRSFSDRADRVVARLRALQRIPLRAPDRPRTP